MLTLVVKINNITLNITSVTIISTHKLQQSNTLKRFIIFKCFGTNKLISISSKTDLLPKQCILVEFEKGILSIIFHVAINDIVIVNGYRNRVI